MRDEPDRLEPSRIDPGTVQNDQGFVRSPEGERPLSDREVVRPRAESQLADAAVSDRGDRKSVV